MGSMGFLPTSVIEEFVKYEYFICFRDIDTELFSLVTCTLCGVLQEMAMKSYSPGHECSSLKRQLYWNKS